MHGSNAEKDRIGTSVKNTENDQYYCHYASTHSQSAYKDAMIIDSTDSNGMGLESASSSGHDLRIGELPSDYNLASLHNISNFISANMI